MRPLRAIATLVLFLAVSGTAAGATLRLDPAAPSNRAAGTVWKFKVIVDRQPGEASHVPTIATLNTTTGRRGSFTARATQEQDVYDAAVKFGSAGDWTYEVTAGDARLTGSISIGSAAGGSGSGWKLLALIASAIALAAIGVVIALLARRPSAPPPETRAPPPPPDLARDRQALIGSHLYLYDVVRDDVLRDRLRQALAEAGVSELDSVGDRFDPSLHRATGWVPTDDPALDGRIAEVERHGFRDRERVLRLPEVRVYSTSGRAKR
jgi:molecular chaperone GrpE